MRINFAPRTQNTVKFSQQGSIVDSATAYTGDDITLPAHKGAVESSYNFVGWVSNVVEETATMPTFHTAGSKYTVSGDATLYALYSRFEGGSGSTSNVFEPYSGTLTEGDYIIVGEGSEGDGAMVAADTGKTRLQYTMVTYTDGDILSPTADMIWHIGADGSYWTVYNAATGKYAGSSGSKNQAKLLDTVEDATKWTATGTSTYELKNKANSAKGINANLRRNGSVGFACYSTATGKPLKLYKRVAGTIYYFTGAAEIGCNHPDAYNVAGKAPTCTEPGYTAGVYCPDCEEYISGHEDLEALNHENAYDVDGKEPTCTEPGYTAGVYCPDCEEFLSGAEEIAASGHDFDTNGVCTVCGAAIGMPGDVNGDGEINTLDGLMLLRHLNDWQVNIAVPNAMDVNADGEVNSLDGLMLMRYLNGWEVTLGKTN